METVEQAKAVFIAAADQEAAAYTNLLSVVEGAVVDRIMTDLVGRVMNEDK